MLAASFIVFGFAYKNKGFVYEKRFFSPFFICMAIVAIGAVFWPTTIGTVSWRWVIPYTITAAFGTLGVFSLSNVLMKNAVISQFLFYVGNKTLLILTWHLLCFKFVSLFIIYVYKLPIESLADFPVIQEFTEKGWWLLYFIVGVAFPLLFNMVYEKILVNVKVKH